MITRAQAGVVVTGSIHIERTGRGARKGIRTGPALAAPDPGRVPRVARLMALAIRFDQLVREARLPTTPSCSVRARDAAG